MDAGPPGWNTNMPSQTMGMVGVTVMVTVGVGVRVTVGVNVVTGVGVTVGVKV